MMSLHDVFSVCSIVYDSYKETIWAQNSIILIETTGQLVEIQSVSYLFIFCGGKKCLSSQNVNIFWPPEASMILSLIPFGCLLFIEQNKTF